MKTNLFLNGFQVKSKSILIKFQPHEKLSLMKFHFLRKEKVVATNLIFLHFFANPTKLRVSFEPNVMKKHKIADYSLKKLLSHSSKLIIHASSRLPPKTIHSRIDDVKWEKGGNEVHPRLPHATNHTTKLQYFNFSSSIFFSFMSQVYCVNFAN